jgi:hypothetical protein
MQELVTPKGIVYACFDPDCMVSISKHDLACGKWRQCEERMPPCPKHGTPMRAFFRASDGFKKVQCGQCRKEGKMTQVMSGKVCDMPPHQQQNWSIDPDDI